MEKERAGHPGWLKRVALSGVLPRCGRTVDAGRARGLCAACVFVMCVLVVSCGAIGTVESGPNMHPDAEPIAIGVDVSPGRSALNADTTTHRTALGAVAEERGEPKGENRMPRTMSDRGLLNI